MKEAQQPPAESVAFGRNPELRSACWFAGDTSLPGAGGVGGGFEGGLAAFGFHDGLASGPPAD
jgi:hypothetical protein